jgi:hypothetical protein
MMRTFIHWLWQTLRPKRRFRIISPLKLEKITSDQKLVSEIVIADIITARTQADPTEYQIYKRPKAEIDARGYPCQVQVLSLMVRDVDDYDYLVGVVNRLKNGD